MSPAKSLVVFGLNRRLLKEPDASCAPVRPDRLFAKDQFTASLRVPVFRKFELRDHSRPPLIA
jgi:hypothetical protein